MNTRNCQLYVYKFPEPSSFHETLFSPQHVVRKDGTLAERIQRWLIDNGDSNRPSKSVYRRTLYGQPSKSIFNIREAIGLEKAIDDHFLAESLAGHYLCTFITSMIFRSIELFFQSMNNTLSASALSPKIKEILNWVTMAAMAGFCSYLGYAWTDISIFILIPIVLGKFLSFKLSNYFRQIHTLSSTKDFELKDFIFKNVQAVLIRAIPITLVLLYLRFSGQLLKYEKSPAWMYLCNDRPEGPHLEEFRRGSFPISDFFGSILEPIVLTLGKMTFDLAYIFILKTLYKTPDLRDPMGWIFSKFRPKLLTALLSKDQNSYIQKYSNKPISKRKRTDKYLFIETWQPRYKEPSNNPLLPTTYTTPKICLDTDSSNSTTLPKTKIKTRGVPYSNSKPVTNTAPKKPQTSIDIEVSGRVLTFQKLEHSSFNKDVWGVIIADSLEIQKLTKYEKSLSSGQIGGNIRQLNGRSNGYEIGSSMDSRLLGKRYDSGVYNALQSFMRMEDALQVSQKLESHGIHDDVSLIVFSTEAKTHKDIFRLAKKL